MDRSIFALILLALAGPAVAQSTDYLGWLSDEALELHGAGQPAEAMSAAKRVVALAQQLHGPDHWSVSDALVALADLYQKQGRHADAVRAYKRSIEIAEKRGRVDDPGGRATKTRLKLGELYRLRGDYENAAPTLERACASLRKTISPARQNCFRALSELYRAQGRYAELALLPKREMSPKDIAYALSHLPQGHQVAQGRGEAPDDIYFGLSQAAQSQAGDAVMQMAARKIDRADTAIANLVRERQDLVASAESRSGDQLEAINSRIGVIDAVFAKRSLKYENLEPTSPKIDEIQTLLSPEEALVLLVTADYGGASPWTFVWAVTKSAVRWVYTELGTKELSENVYALRCGLDLTLWEDASNWSETTEELIRQRATQIDQRRRCETLTKAKPRKELAYSIGPPVDVLPFDAARAHALYKALFGQVEDVIQNKHLLIVASGPLASLPFSVLVTEPPRSNPIKLADYRTIAWLGTRQPIAVLPSVASLKALRAAANVSVARRAFLGIGNPLLDGSGLSQAGLAQAARDKQTCPERSATEPQVATFRGRRASPFTSVFRGRHADVANVRKWDPLPETADELCRIRGFLDGLESEILLGASATESVIKDLSASGQLADYRIVHFATHGALTGQVEGSAEPGLILTPPAPETSDEALERDDGFLTASEIATLKLDADWVILSACNTAAASGETAEALSGMARAFFYAGARALLVSHWEVGSLSSVELTTRSFQELKTRPEIGRSEALLISMRELIERGHTWQAHPSQWAPFVLVGEGGRVR
jgi:CHAT domain-containing protein/tetratricopeptide (TPR) repeat protein